MTKIIIVGGVAGGASAAARARRLSEDAEIIMLERGEFISFANCGLPYHVSGDITQRDALLLQTPQSFKSRFNVDVRIFSEVVAIDRQQKVLTVKNVLSGEEYKESYDKLLLSPGAAPIRPPIPGINSANTFSLRNIPDMDRIVAAVSQNKPQHATVVGGGFIGLEMVEALHQLGIAVTLLELSEQVMAPVDLEMANFVHQVLLQKQTDLRLNTGLTAITELPEHLELTLSNGEKLTTGLVILAIGVKPEIMLASAAGLELGARGGIKVDDGMRTSDPDIYAVGDAVETLDFVTAQPALIPLAGPANRQGRIAADNMLGRDEKYQRTQGTAICKIFDFAIASTGHSEKSLRRQGRAYEKVYVHPGNHAGYYPGAFPVSFKLIFDPVTGQILGGQAFGKEGVDKRIDVLAVAMRAGLKVQDLEHLELTYAPPFGSARDVINQAGMVAANVIKGDERVCHTADVLNISPEQFLLDVRNPGELTKIGTIAGAVNIPVDQLRERLAELPKDKEILITCQVGLRGHVAYRLLANHGFNARNLSGGFKTFQITTAKF
ncbi:FAD-dependent oxidoreductase [uncultured Tolumonas sp.]|uniref:FAD-dependent oxidoreductase n=1 Tax=uncultured Tolumonas sp. TaxID=263765 RepID=UPI00292F51B0|nr:FAD-dependent oxidoreductase [uncultured Tolumonas sp.]